MLSYVPRPCVTLSQAGLQLIVAQVPAHCGQLELLAHTTIQRCPRQPAQGPARRPQQAVGSLGDSMSPQTYCLTWVLMNLAHRVLRRCFGC